MNTEVKKRSALLWYLATLALQGPWILFWLFRMNNDLRALGAMGASRLIYSAMLAVLILIICVFILIMTYPPFGTILHDVLVNVAFVSAIMALVLITWALVVLNAQIVALEGKDANFLENLKVILLSVAFFVSIPYMQSRMNRFASTTANASSPRA